MREKLFRAKKKNWRDCQCFGKYNTCGAVRRYIEPIVGKIPDWCPIRPIPKRKPLTGDVSNYEKLGQELIRVGWNNCLDEMGL